MKHAVWPCLTTYAEVDVVKRFGGTVSIFLTKYSPSTLELILSFLKA
jgi:hypothetical protein